MALAFAPGTPEPARELLHKLASDPDTDPRTRAAIVRLATMCPAMADLWKALPSEPAGIAADLIGQTLVAYVAALNLQPPIPRTKRAFADYLSRHELVPLTFATLATEAEMLLENLQKLPSTVRGRWHDASPTGSEFHTALRAIEDIAAACDRLNRDAKAISTAINLPMPGPRRGALKAQRTYFGVIMSDYFARITGNPCDRIVTILEDVIFDLRGEIEETTARSRRRGRKPR
jgi:hypothetical protein